MVMSEPSSLEAAQDEEEEGEELMMSHVFLLFVSPSAPSQKINRRLHLSKVKHSKFNESGQLVAFHLTSLIWCLYVVVTVRLAGIWVFRGNCGFWSTKSHGQQSPQPASEHISASSLFSCGGSFQPLHEGSFGRSFSCTVQGTGEWAVKYLWS